jgi:hypothetical protein
LLDNVSVVKRVDLPSLERLKDYSAMNFIKNPEKMTQQLNAIMIGMREVRLDACLHGFRPDACTDPPLIFPDRGFYSNDDIRQPFAE